MITIFGISGLCSHSLARVRFPFLEKCDRKDIASSLPYASSTAWMTLWSGTNPSHHGIIEYDDKIDGKLLSLHSLWRSLNDLKVVVRKRLVMPNTPCDVLIYDLRDSMFKNGKERYENLQHSVGQIQDMIEKHSLNNVIIVSAYGYAEHQYALNIDRYLFSKQLLFIKAGEVDMDRSKLYPSIYINGKSIPCFGIYISDWVEQLEAIKIKAEVITQLSKYPGVRAMSREYYYENGGVHIKNTPDIVFGSPECVTFIRSAGATSMATIEPYSAAEPCNKGYIATDIPMTLSIDNIENVKDCISGYVLANVVGDKKIGELSTPQ